MIYMSLNKKRERERERERESWEGEAGRGRQGDAVVMQDGKCDSDNSGEEISLNGKACMVRWMV